MPYCNQSWPQFVASVTDSTLPADILRLSPPKYGAAPSLRTLAKRQSVTPPKSLPLEGISPKRRLVDRNFTSAHRRVSRCPVAYAPGRRDTSSKPPRFIRHRRRFGGFPAAVCDTTARPFRYVSSPHRKRFAGLRRGPHKKEARRNRGIRRNAACGGCSEPNSRMAPACRDRWEREAAGPAVSKSVPVFTTNGSENRLTRRWAKRWLPAGQTDEVSLRGAQRRGNPYSAASLLPFSLQAFSLGRRRLPIRAAG